jgi:hypothetical protein
VVILGTRLTFFNDDWSFLLQRPGLTADSVLAPHNGHLSALPVLVYKGLVALFGLDSQVPFRLVLAATVASVGVLVYALVSERVGAFAGLVAAALVVFLGPAWEDLLWSFQIGLLGSLATGLGALLALERDSPRRNTLACLALVGSISLSDLGLPFVVAAAFAVALRRRPAQLWIAGVPGALFGAWWLAYGSDAPSHLSGANVRHLPRYMLDAAANGLASIAGVNNGTVTATSTRGLALLIVVALALAAWRLRGGRPSAWLLVFAAALLTFWGLAGASYTPGREAAASRYQLVDAAVLIVIGAELLRGTRLRGWQVAGVAAVAAAVLVANLVKLGGGFDFMREHSDMAKVDLGALEITRGLAAPSFQLSPAIAHDPYLTGVTAGRYFDEVEAHGSPGAASPARVAAASAAQRQAADNVLAAAYRMLPGRAPRGAGMGHCRRLAAGRGADAEIPPGGAVMSALDGAPLALGVRRFAPASLPVSVGALDPGSSARITVPRDGLPLRWHLTARGASALRICAL